MSNYFKQFNEWLSKIPKLSLDLDLPDIEEEATRDLKPGETRTVERSTTTNVNGTTTKQTVVKITKG